MPVIREVDVELPHPVLPGADWADAYEVDLPERRMAASEAAHLPLGRMPGWARRLLSFRNALARIVGLKTGPDGSVGKDRRIGMFPILSESPDRIVLGLDDWHLDFRIVTDVCHDGAGGSRIRMTTLVERKNVFGRAYIGIVGPFHRLIVPTTLRGVS